MENHFYLKTGMQNLNILNADANTGDRGSCMSAHVFNKLEKNDKIGGLPSILLLFRNKFNKFNNTGERMLDSIYHMTLNLIKNHIFGLKTSRFCHLLLNVIMDLITFPENLNFIA